MNPKKELLWGLWVEFRSVGVQGVELRVGAEVKGLLGFRSRISFRCASGLCLRVLVSIVIGPL